MGGLKSGKGGERRKVKGESGNEWKVVSEK